MPDPQQGQQEHLVGHEGEDISGCLHKERPDPCERKSNPGKRARRDQHPRMNPIRHCCNTRQHFKLFKPANSCPDIFEGKNNFFPKQNTMRTKQRLHINVICAGEKSLF